MKCCIPNCLHESKSSFGIPKDKKLLKLWEKALGFTFAKSNSRVARESHFESSDVTRVRESRKALSKYTVSV